MFDFIVKHKIYPTVEVFDFADFQKAYDHLLTGKPKYRCVIKV
jgi:D-arabinose 1-dehydrogenase-like Zn-dependent alcohol dehydrogenase